MYLLCFLVYNYAIHSSAMKQLFIALSLILLLSDCRKSHPVDTVTQCTERVRIDSMGYVNSMSWISQIPTLDSLYIVRDCLHIVVSDDGCESSTWNMELYDSEGIRYISPPSRNLNFSFENKEPCTNPQRIQREFSFDISTLRVPDYDQVMLILPYYYKRITYSY